MRLGIEDAARSLNILRPGLEVIERGEACDDGSQGAGDLWIGSVGPVLLSVEQVAMERGMKCTLKLADRAGELDGHAPLGNLVHGKAAAR